VSKSYCETCEIKVPRYFIHPQTWMISTPRDTRWRTRQNPRSIVPSVLASEITGGVRSKVKLTLNLFHGSRLLIYHSQFSNPSSCLLLCTSKEVSGRQSKDIP
jgi:hypothetical protein